MSVEHGEARNDRAGQVSAETVVYRPPAVLRPFVERYVGYRYLGYEPGVHLGMPGRHLTVIISFDDPLTLAMDPAVDDTTSDHDGMVSGPGPIRDASRGARVCRHRPVRHVVTESGGGAV